MNYIGSKHRLREFLKQEIKKVVGDDLSQKVFCDIFAGSGAVGKAFKSEVRQVISNDMEHYSYVLNKNYIENITTIKNQDLLIQELNLLPLVEDGFIYQNYCKNNRQYFSHHNGKKIDTIRRQIELWKETNYINQNTYYFLLASLIEDADKVANTTSVYSAFLKKLKKTAQKKLILSPAEFETSSNTHLVYNQDSNILIKNISGDILYLDPPYNRRQYGAAYHILNTISLYDKFIPYGKTGIRPDYHKSTFAKAKLASKAFEQLIKDADFHYIFLSYNNKGIMDKKQIELIMSKYGKYSLVKTEYKKFHTNKNQETAKTFEYLHILEKST